MFMASMILLNGNKMYWIFTLVYWNFKSQGIGVIFICHVEGRNVPRLPGAPSKDSVIHDVVASLS